MVWFAVGWLMLLYTGFNFSNC